MNGRCFVDTNIAIYALEVSSQKSIVATALLRSNPVMSTQVIMETVNVLIKKFHFTKRDAFEHAKFLIYNGNIVSVDQEIILQAADISERYGFSHWDCLIVASALSSGCNILYSEDLKDGQVINERMTIRNPFLPNSIPA